MAKHLCVFAALSCATQLDFLRKHKGFPARHDVMPGPGWAVLLVLAISDRSAICRFLSLFVVDRLVRAYCRLFRLTLVTCQLRGSAHPKNFVISKGNARANTQKRGDRGVKSFFSPAEAITGSLETLLTIGRRQSKQKKNSPIYSALLWRLRDTQQRSIKHRALDNTTILFNLPLLPPLPIYDNGGRKMGGNRGCARVQLLVLWIKDGSCFL